MRNAFIKAMNTKAVQGNVAEMIGYSLQRIKPKQVDGWNASLSFRTFKKLQAEGYEKFSG